MDSELKGVLARIMEKVKVTPPEARRAEWVRLRRKQWLPTATIPRSIVKQVSSGYDPSGQALETDRGPWERMQWIDRPCIVLSGQSGTGKSISAGCWLWHGFDPDDHFGDSAAWVAADWMASQRDHGRYPWVRRLVVDDLGSESGREAKRLARFICARFDDDRRRTVITTPLCRDELAPRYGDRLASRLSRAAWIDCVDVLGATSVDDE